MNAFLKSVKSSIYSRETAIKNSIIGQLSTSVKEIQLCGASENASDAGIDVTEAGNTLCIAIEAMFLHGIKDSIALRVRKAITDLDEKPEPNFWSPLLVISHRQIIDQITKLSQITTEIGQCRAWIRIALNDCLLSSYLMSLRHDSQTLKPYYNNHALLRDSDQLDVVKRLIEGLEASNMTSIPCNSSLLNTWPTQSLLLAGIWTPPMRLTVASGVDIAESIDTTRSVKSDTCSLGSISYQSYSSGIGQMVNEDEALKIILAKHSLSDNNKSSTTSSSEAHKSNESSDLEKSIQNSDTKSPFTGNSLNQKSGWSFDETQPVLDNELEKNNKEKTEKQEENMEEGPKSMEHSYNALIESYNMLGANTIKTPNLQEIWQKLEIMDQDSGREEEEKTVQQVQPYVENNLSRSSSTSIPLAIQIGQLAHEKGLDNQNYECAGCKQELGITSQLRVCNFTGEYYCETCMSKDPVIIPAKVIHNWDFKTYPVSQKAYNYLEEIKDHPTIDMKVLNPLIYVAVEEMGKLQILRNQLNFLRAYLYTCREPVIEELQKKMWPREYMYEHIHQYSISDLSQITDGTLSQLMQKVIVFGREHVLGCWLCSQKGFLCEICNKSKPLFPFDTDSVFRCDMCSAVYHNECLNPSKPCPKCKRKKERRPSFEIDEDL